MEAPALPLVALRLRRGRAVEPVRADRPRHGDVDAAEGIDQILEVGEVDDHHVVDRDPGELTDRADRERRTSDLEPRVDLLGARARNGDLEVPRDREVVEAGGGRTGPKPTGLSGGERRPAAAPLAP